MTAREENGLYVVEEKASYRAMIQTQQDSELVKWHKRFGYLNFNNVQNLKNKQMAIGMNKDMENSNPVCEVC